MTAITNAFENKLDVLAARGRLRRLNLPAGADFSSNDYLGLARSPELATRMIDALNRGVATGSGGSRLLRGHHEEHEALEEEAARFFGSERMLYFGGGFSANVAILSTLPQPGDLILHDMLVHASAHDGMRASRADVRGVAHNEAAAFEDAIRLWRREGGKGHPWIVVESLYSMDGDIAPLADLAEIADRHQAFLVIDEAHATGVHGPDGRGFAAALEGRENVITLHTCGKALGAFGGLVGASRTLCDFLINRARPFIYATAPPPLQALAVLEALKLVQSQPERRTALQDLANFANKRIGERLGIATSGTQIVPIHLGEDARAVRVAARLQAAGFDVRAIRPPTVPARTARLRITITLNVDQGTIERMVDQLAYILEDER
ncbi:8-amino-7-oxononanoate synthase [Rhizobium lemnae]|uniref:8-amino-7-oxononanoate synthase n=1 Tax=Rhizobium lemnae TaxID=1214924 RepID=A0ABV8ECS7_9HYPH|nr:8-amino-7-oxononanoate synthase [Rhizobium lemnae]MCJ8509974.1 8-amino-7-oxononanoate synthase [Rhizobium lemnae]